MKLHLPSALRKALLSCLAVASSLVPCSILSSSLVGGLCLFSFAHAASLPSADEDEDDDYLRFADIFANKIAAPGIATYSGWTDGTENTYPYVVDAGDTVTVDLTLNPSTGLNDTALSMGAGSILRGTLTLATNTRIDTDGNTAYIESNINANGYTLRIWSNGFVFRNGTISGLGNIEVLAPSSHAYIEQDLSPANMNNNATTFWFNPNAGNGGNLHLRGHISGFETLNVRNQGSGGQLYIEGSFTGADSGTLTKTNSGKLYFQGGVSGVRELVVSDGSVYIESTVTGLETLNIASGKTVYIQGDGKFEGSENLTVKGTGTLQLANDINIDLNGTLRIEGNGTTVAWGTDQTCTSSLGFSEIVITGDGAKLIISHVAEEEKASHTSIHLSGGAWLRIEDMTPENEDTTIRFKKLVLDSGNGNLEANWNGGTSFEELTGNGRNIYLNKATYDSGNKFKLHIDKLHDYTGGLVWNPNMDDNKKSTYLVEIDGANQSEESHVATIGEEERPMRVLSNNYTMEGQGSVTLYGNHEVSGYMTMEGGTYTIYGSQTLARNMDMNGGTFTVTGSQTVGGTFTMSGGSFTLNEGNQSIGNGLTVTAGNYEVNGDLTSSGGLRVVDGNVHVSGLLTVGAEMWMTTDGKLTVDGGIAMTDKIRLRYGVESNLLNLSKMGDLTNRNIYVNVMDSDYFTEGAVKDGVDTGVSTSVLLNYLYALGYTRGQYELYQNEKTGTWWLRADALPSVDPDENDGIWDMNWSDALAERPVGITPGAIPVAKSNDEEVFMGEGGTYIGPTMLGDASWAQFNEYSIPRQGSIFGGQSDTTEGDTDLSSWIDVVAGDYKVIAGGNSCTHWDTGTQKNFNGDSHIQLRRTGSRDTSVTMVVGGNYQAANDSHFNGDSYISIESGVKVQGGVVGGSLFSHGGEADFNGNTHIFIYTVLEESDTTHLTPGDNLQVVVGGNFVQWNTPGTHTSKGNSNISISLGGGSAATRSSAQFGKLIVGGDLIGPGEGSDTGGELIHDGDTHISITGAGGVSFTQQVIGGSYDASGSSTVITGDTNVTIDSGAYDNAVVAGSVRGVLGATGAGLDPDVASATIEGSTHLVIRGGEFYGHSVDATTLPTAESEKTYTYSLGKVAVVGGNHSTNLGVVIGKDAGSSAVAEGTNITISGGTFAGHIIGASAAECANDETMDLGSISVGKSTVVMTGGKMVQTQADGNAPQNWTPRLVGGLLLNLPTITEAKGNFSIGDISVTVGGSADVYDVVGGSWTSMLDAEKDDRTVQQGHVKVSLQGNATVRGNVYAAGIQGGSTRLQTESVEVEVGAGVRFARSSGYAVISGGYLTTRRADSSQQSGLWVEEQSAYTSLYKDSGDESAVLGSSTLRFTDATDYGDNLAKARLIDFDTVKLQEGTKVTVAGLLRQDKGNITISGDGELAMSADLLEVKDVDGKQLFNNSTLQLQDKATLHLLPTTNGVAAYVQAISAADGTNVTIETAQKSGVNDAVLVSEGISVGNGRFTMSFNAHGDMLNRAIIRRGAVGADQATLPVLALNGSTVSMNIMSMDTVLFTGENITLLLAEDVDAQDFTVDSKSLEGLEKWFVDAPEVRTKGDYLVLTGRTVSSATADFHTRHAITENGRTGAAMLDNLYTTLNPEWSDPAGDRAALLKAMEQKFANYAYDEADRAMAAAGGASLPTIGQAFAGDVDRQLRAIRNRTTTMGLNGDYHYDDLPRIQFWLNAEGDYRKVNSEDTFSGYRVNSWGGTVGITLDLGASDTIGLAVSAMYGDLQANGADSLRADMVTTYVTAFWRKSSNSWTHTVIATAGLANADGHRTVDYGTGSYRTDLSPDGYAVGLMYEVGYSIPLNADASICAQPVVNITWRHSQISSFSEDGSDAGLEVDSMKNDTFIISAGARAQALTDGNWLNRSCILEGRALLKGYLGDRQAEAKTRFAGAKRSGEMKGRELGAVGLELGAGFSIPFENDSLFFDVSAELRSAETNFNATIGYKLSF